MRLKVSNGSIKKVTEVTAAVEFRSHFNGTVRRLLEPCKDSTVRPNALVFAFDDRNQPMGIFQPSMGSDDRLLLLGNLAAEQAEEIINSLLKEEYAAISGIKLQKHRFALEKYVMDDGVSDAYAFTTNCPGMIFTNSQGMVNIFSPNGISAEVEDGDSDDGEPGEDC